MGKTYYSQFDKRLISEKSSWIIDSHGLKIRKESSSMIDDVLEVGDKVTSIGKRGSAAYASVQASKGWYYEYLGRILYKKYRLFIFTAFRGDHSIDHMLKRFCESAKFKKPLFCLNEIDDGPFMYSTPSCSMRIVTRDIVRYKEEAITPSVGDQLEMRM